MASSKLSRCVDEIVTEFLDQISERYHIPKSELVDLWEGDIPPPVVQTNNYCNHQFTKGQRVGMVCQQKIGDHETKCSKHRSKKRTPASKEQTEVVGGAAVETTSDILNQFNKLTFSAEHSDSD